jgi:hypothetical protein
MIEFISGHLDAAEHNLGTGVSEHSVEQRWELPVPIADEVTPCAAGVFKVHSEIPHGLPDPGDPS